MFTGKPLSVKVGVRHVYSVKTPGPTLLKKNCSCSLAKLMHACSKLFLSKCSNPNISSNPENKITGFKSEFRKMII